MSSRDKEKEKAFFGPIFNKPLVMLRVVGVLIRRVQEKEHPQEAGLTASGCVCL